MSGVKSNVSFNLNVPAPKVASSGTTSAAPKTAPKAASTATSVAASSVGGGGQQDGSDKRGARGKGRGKQLPTEAQIAANDAEAKVRAANAELKLLEIEAKKAEAQARIDKVKSGASSAPEVSTPRPQGGRGVGDFVTHDQFQAGINHLNGTITKGFDQVFSKQSIAAEQQALTNATLAGFVRMMGTNGTGFSLPAPVSRQIGNGGAQELAEPTCQISYGQNAGWDQAAERSDRSLASSSQRSQSGAACGGGSASDSSRFAINKEPQTELRSSSGGSTLVAVRHLGSHLPKFEANFAKLDRNDFNVFAGATIRNFVANFALNEQDEMACVLLGMVNGKKYPAHNHIIIQSNASVFSRFFGELATKFPGNAVRITNNLGQKCGFPFKTVSNDQSAMWSLIRVLRGEE